MSGADVLDVANLLFDALFYDPHVRTRQSSRHEWPLGQPQRATSPLCVQAPMSIMNEISEFCAHPGNRNSMPLLRPTAIKFEMISNAWQRILSETLPGINTEKKCIPVSTVEHETTQLCWGRKDIPVCASRHECEALTLQGAPGPLPIYLPVTEQDEFDLTKKLPNVPRFCLLCIRRDAHALSMLQASLPVSTAQTGRAAFVVPPFVNLVDVPGGYRSSAFCKPIEQSRIVALSGQLNVCYDALHEKWHINQGNIVFGAPLNCQATI